MHVNIVIADAIVKRLNLEKERENKDPRQVSLGPEVEDGKRLLLDGWPK